MVLGAERGLDPLRMVQHPRRVCLALPERGLAGVLDVIIQIGGVLREAHRVSTLVAVIKRDVLQGGGYRVREGEGMRVWGGEKLGRNNGGGVVCVCGGGSMHMDAQGEVGARG